MSDALQQLPDSTDLIKASDERLEGYRGDVVLQGNPEAALRARDRQEVAEMLNYCHQKQIPVTFMGGQTGLTGASAAEDGLVIVTEKMDRVLDIGTRPGGTPTVDVEPGIYLGDLKQAVAAEGFFYPPDPTSYHEARLGGTISTNATGEDTLLYGPTRAYVRRLKLIQADGTPLELERPREDSVPWTKGTAGYTRSDPLIDLFIGSEGTLAYIAEATLDLLPAPPDHWAALGFFDSLDSALKFVSHGLQSDQVTARAMELFDEASLKFFKSAVEVPPLPEGAKAAVYWKAEYHDEAEAEQSLEKWYELFTGLDVWLAQSPKQHQQFRSWRHHVPSLINETVHGYRQEGGAKVAGDWWVPAEFIEESLRQVRQESLAAGLEPIIFGHIGNGHPHVNYLARTTEEYQKGMKLIYRQCQRAVKWGGGVAGEHGLGKIHRNLLQVQHSQKVIDKMMTIKRHWDPHWILGRGTLFEVPEEFS